MLKKIQLIEQSCRDITFCNEKLWGKMAQSFKNSISVLSAEANIKVLFVPSCHLFSPTDIGISVGDKEEFLQSAPFTLHFISLPPEFHSE